MKIKSNLSESDFKIIAKNAGLSTITVRKWFKGKLVIKPETERKILDAFLEVSMDSIRAIEDYEAKNEILIRKLGEVNEVYGIQKSLIAKRIETIKKT